LPSLKKTNISPTQKIVGVFSHPPTYQFSLKRMTHPFDFAVWGTGVALVTIQSITRQLLEAERADGSCGPKREILENSSRPNLFICLPWLDGCGICLLLAFFFVGF